jgi:hypothetical protein
MLTAMVRIPFHVAAARVVLTWGRTGLVDFIWVDKHFGGVQTWINGGIRPALDSSMFWDKQPDIWRDGVERGHNIHFPTLVSTVSIVGCECTADG